VSEASEPGEIITRYRTVRVELCYMEILSVDLHVAASQQPNSIELVLADVRF